MHDWVMSARCPVCGAAATKVVAGGYFQCEAPVAAATGAPPSGAFGPTTVITSCGWRFLPTELAPEATSALESAAQREREARAAAERQQRAEQDAMALLPEVSRLFLQHGQRKPTRVVFTTTFAPPGMGPVRFTKDALRAEKTPAAGSFRSWVPYAPIPGLRPRRGAGKFAECYADGWWLPGYKHESHSYEIGGGHGSGSDSQRWQALLLSDGRVAQLEIKAVEGAGDVARGTAPYLRRVLSDVMELVDSSRHAWPATAILDFLSN
jgi:hypothetical protein